MSFKFRRALLLLPIPILVLTMVSCSQFLDGKQKKDETIELGGDQFACVNQLSDNLQLLVNGDATADKIEASFNCLHEALVFFNQRTKGSYPEGYSTTDLRKFFGKYFFKDNNIGEPLAESLMKLKQGLFGGDQKQLSKTELAELIDFWTILKGEVLAVNPYIKTLLPNLPKSRPSATEVDAAVNQLQKSVRTLLVAVNLPHSDYSVGDLQTLINGLYQFLHPQDDPKNVAGFRKYIPLGISIKNLLLGNPAELSQQADWLQCIDSLSQLYRVVLLYEYNDFKFDFTQKSNVSFLLNFGEQIIQLLDQSFLMKTKGAISFELVDAALVEFDQLGSFAGTAKLSTWMETYKSVVSRFLEGIHDTRRASALTQSNFQVLKREFSILKFQQKWIDSMFAASVSGPSFSDADFQARILNPDFNKLLVPSVVPVALQADLQKAHLDFIHELQKPKPVKFTDLGDMLIIYDQKFRPWTWISLTRSNLMLTLTRLFELGYGVVGLGEINQLSITEATLVQWYDDFMKLGVELKAFDPRSGNSGKRTFKEANFFTFSGNGDQLMSFDECYEFLSNLFSSGIGNANRLITLMQKSGCALPEIDVFGNPFLKEDCFERILRSEYSKIFPNLEYQSIWVGKHNDYTWNRFYTAAMAAARVTPALKGIKVETGDIRTLVVILHYIESLYTIYDTNRNGILDLDELRVASGRFHDFIAPLVPDLPVGKEYLIREGFVTLVVTGKEDFLSFKWDEIWGTNPPVTEINLLDTIVYLKDKIK